MFHNMRAGATLADAKVRKAIDLAIDRKALSQRLKGGRGTRSLFPDVSPYFSDASDPHGNKVEAAKLLKDAGWTLTNGKLSKGGKDLTVTLVAYGQRPGLVIHHQGVW